MIGSHCIRTWSSTQPSVTLSSSEAEFYGLVKASGAGLGHQSLVRHGPRHASLRLDGLECRARDSDSILSWETEASRDAHLVGAGEG